MTCFFPGTLGAIPERSVRCWSTICGFPPSRSRSAPAGIGPPTERPIGGIDGIPSGDRTAKNSGLLVVSR